MQCFGRFNGCPGFEALVNAAGSGGTGILSLGGFLLSLEKGWSGMSALKYGCGGFCS